MRPLGRWAFEEVPVELFEEFLKELKAHGQVKTAAQAVGISPQKIRSYVQHASELMEDEDVVNHLQSHIYFSDKYTDDMRNDALRDTTNAVLTPEERTQIVKIWLYTHINQTLGAFKSKLLKDAKEAIDLPVSIGKEAGGEAKSIDTKVKVIFTLLKQTDHDEFGFSERSENQSRAMIINNIISGRNESARRKILGEHPAVEGLPEGDGEFVDGSWTEGDDMSLNDDADAAAESPLPDL